MRATKKGTHPNEYAVFFSSLPKKNMPERSLHFLYHYKRKPPGIQIQARTHTHTRHSTLTHTLTTCRYSSTQYCVDFLRSLSLSSSLHVLQSAKSVPYQMLIVIMEVERKQKPPHRHLYHANFIITK